VPIFPFSECVSIVRYNVYIQHAKKAQAIYRKKRTKFQKGPWVGTHLGRTHLGDARFFDLTRCKNEQSVERKDTLGVFSPRVPLSPERMRVPSEIAVFRPRGSNEYHTHAPPPFLQNNIRPAEPHHSIRRSERPRFFSRAIPHHSPFALTPLSFPHDGKNAPNHKLSCSHPTLSLSLPFSLFFQKTTTTTTTHAKPQKKHREHRETNMRSHGSREENCLARQGQEGGGKEA